MVGGPIISISINDLTSQYGPFLASTSIFPHHLSQLLTRIMHFYFRPLISIFPPMHRYWRGLWKIFMKSSGVRIKSKHVRGDTRSTTWAQVLHCQLFFCYVFFLTRLVWKCRSIPTPCKSIHLKIERKGTFKLPCADSFQLSLQCCSFRQWV